MATPFQWLQQSGPHHPKHTSGNWYHPLTVCVVYYTIVIASSILLHDLCMQIVYHYNNHQHHVASAWTDSTATTTIHNHNYRYYSEYRAQCVESIPLHIQLRRHRIAYWMLSYSIGILLWRLFIRQEVVPKSASSSSSCIPTRNTTTTTASNNNQGTNMRHDASQSSSSQSQSSSNDDEYSTKTKPLLLYEFCWLCNVTLVMSAIGLYTHRPLMVLAYAIVVAIDQVLWYVDIFGYVVSGGTMYLTGVIRYLSWPENQHWTSYITCTHHLWTIPLILYGCFGSGLGAGGSSNYHHIVLISYFPLSFLYMTINVVLSRYMIPSHVVFPTTNNNNDKKTKNASTPTSAVVPETTSRTTTTKYLNVNLSYELWKDIKFAILQINYDHPPASVYLFRLLWRWHGFNTLLFGLGYSCYYLSLYNNNNGKMTGIMVC